MGSVGVAALHVICSALRDLLVRRAALSSVVGMCAKKVSDIRFNNFDSCQFRFLSGTPEFAFRIMQYWSCEPLKLRNFGTLEF